MTAAHVASSDGVELTVHHLVSGETSRPLLVAHATGFHGLAYGPMADRLTGGHDVWALDFRGHGATLSPADAPLDWARYGDDALAAAEWLARRAGDDASLAAFGHSMGGATLLMAAERSPGLFGSLVLYEPIVFPPPGSADEALVAAGPARPSPKRRVDDGARSIPTPRRWPTTRRSRRCRRSPRRPSRPTCGAGLRPVDPADPDGPVELCCSPETEAATFEGGAAHDTWDRLGHIVVPTMVLGGALDAPPPRLVEAIAARLPNGRGPLHPELDHFAPFSEPARTADLVSAALTPGI